MSEKGDDSILAGVVAMTWYSMYETELTRRQEVPTWELTTEWRFMTQLAGNEISDGLWNEDTSTVDRIRWLRRWRAILQYNVRPRRCPFWTYIPLRGPCYGRVSCSSKPSEASVSIIIMLDSYIGTHNVHNVTNWTETGTVGISMDYSAIGVVAPKRSGTT